MHCLVAVWVGGSCWCLVVVRVFAAPATWSQPQPLPRRCCAFGGAKFRVSNRCCTFLIRCCCTLWRVLGRRSWFVGHFDFLCAVCFPSVCGVHWRTGPLLVTSESNLETLVTGYIYIFDCVYWFLRWKESPCSSFVCVFMEDTNIPQIGN